ncbi:DUF1772 domain-containing protein [Brevibacterium spongiae]|uniref:DUF1772 domain-containing protein n=1 Tax=Brevibacterium spongiae TaxID=2909672 RepID=A0ABY5SRQ6_9MICO|nr:anthrone oxygenase family protein [Brevibacterium spongiae]UVI36596.1 DUF1772 domain-containing protein [Brevibacterium spongiae]
MQPPIDDSVQVLPQIVLAAAIISNGLLAGVFFGFTTAICPGLKRVDDPAYVRAFRAINSVILNGRFIAVFLLAPLSAVAYAVIGIVGQDPVASTAGSASALCALLSTVITAAANVPLNRTLDAAAIGSAEDRALARNSFEGPWNRWHLVRTVASATALLALTIPLLIG